MRTPTLVDPFETGPGDASSTPKANDNAAAPIRGEATTGANGKANRPPERRVDGPTKPLPGVETWARMRCWCSED